jgi:hypothetical protein
VRWADLHGTQVSDQFARRPVVLVHLTREFDKFQPNPVVFMQVMHNLDLRARHQVGYVGLMQIPPTTAGKGTA